MPVRKRPRRHIASWLAALVLPCAAAGEEPWPALRNHNPFLQIFGLPAFEPGTPVPPGETRYAIDLDLANHADSGSTPAESVVLDGESHYLSLAFRRGMSDRLVLGIDIPFVRHSGGFLDASIENWHDFWGLSNRQRSGPRGQLSLRYDNPELAGFGLESSTAGLGDIRLNARFLLWREPAGTDRQFGVQAGVKLPTGAAGELLGSGAADYSLAFHASDATLVSRPRIGLSASVGVLFLGRGDVLPEIQRDSVPFGGLAAAWHASDRLALAVAVLAQGPYYDSALEEIGGNSVQLSVGGLYELPWQGTSLSVGIIEDLYDNATTDIAFKLAFRGVLHQPGP